MFSVYKMLVLTRDGYHGIKQVLAAKINYEAFWKLWGISTFIIMYSLLQSLFLRFQLILIFSPLMINMSISNSQQRRVDRKINRLKAEMAGIRKQQQCIRQGQREIRQRFEEIESECDELKKETELVSQASDNIQLRLDIMLKILKARQENDFAKAADLTCSLRLVFRIFFSYLIFFMCN